MSKSSRLFDGRFNDNSDAYVALCTTFFMYARVNLIHSYHNSIKKWQKESQNQLPFIKKWRGCSIPRVLCVTSVLDYRVSSPLLLSLWNIDTANALDMEVIGQSHIKNIPV